MKRGGDRTSLSIDDVEEPAGERLEELFEKEWIRSLFELAVEDLRKLSAARNTQTHFQIFERYDLENADVSYADRAKEFWVAVTDVTNYLAWSRREFRKLIMERIREITVNDAEFRREAKLVLGDKT